MGRKAQTTRQHVNRINISVIKILYEDDLIYHLEDDGTITHDPLHFDPDCPCHEEDEGDTSSDYALALASYCADFYSIVPAGFNSGGLCLERHIADRVLRGVA